MLFSTDDLQTRIVNIKTEYTENVLYSIQQSLWTTLRPISERIMQIWDARVEDTEKVFFLFSINGTKQYCGLAEVSGPWNPNMQVEGWTDPSSGFVG